MELLSSSTSSDDEMPSVPSPPSSPTPIVNLQQIETAAIDNNNDDLLPDKCSYTSDDFYGRNVMISDYPGVRDEAEWIEYLNEPDRIELRQGITKIQAEDWKD